MATPKQDPPKWWSKVIKDLEKAVASAQGSFRKPGTIIGYVDTDAYQKDGLLIRLPKGDVGFYKIQDKAEVIPTTGNVIKGELPEPDRVVGEPDISSFIFEVIRERIKLVPQIWLKNIIKKMLRSEPIIYDNSKTFNEWVMLNPAQKKDKELLRILQAIVKYEGLKGLSRFNDIKK
jgi:hypothetical protein